MYKIMGIIVKILRINFLILIKIIRKILRKIRDCCKRRFNSLRIIRE